MSYTINQLAKLANISVRTLHHYDAIGLLHSGRNARNHYRIYEEADLLKLQQILFFRELDFKLEDIQAILESPNFDMARALADHRQMIVLKRKRLNALIETIDMTLNKITNKKSMKDEELYDAFSDEEMKELAAEAKERWGSTDAYKESIAKVGKMTKTEMEAVKQEWDALLQKGVALVELNVASDEVQAYIASYYQHLSKFYAPSKEIFEGLAQMYIDDPRFTATFTKHHPQLPRFLHDAMIVFADTLEK
jgi:DNA-binding transcriptional MerR regulator